MGALTALLQLTGFAERTPAGSKASPALSSDVLRLRPPPAGPPPLAGLPCATAAVSAEHPEPRSERSDLSVLQQHMLFFTRDGAGRVIYPLDTFIGFRKIGMDWFLSVGSMFVIHSAFSYPTGTSWLPSPFFPIFLARAHRTKHGSDTGTIDTEGRFTPAKFEEIFSKWGKGGALAWSDVNAMLYDTRSINDPFGWFATRSEWWVLWWLAAQPAGDGTRVLTKERVRLAYQGLLWPVLEEETTRRRGHALYPPPVEGGGAQNGGGAANDGGQQHNHAKSG